MVPTGFRFNPTDEELIEILETKASGCQMPLHFNFIVERNVYEHQPQDLQWEHTSVVADNEKYCYCMRRNDSRQVSGFGWWKATSHVKKIYNKTLHLIGYKRPLTFYKFSDNQPKRHKALKTNWIMHEYSLHSNKTEWRLCRVKYKGKPSVQEELENIRNVYSLRHDFEVASSSTSRNMMQPAYLSSEALQQLPQPSFDHNVYEPIVTSQLDPPDNPSEESFPSLWTWQI